MQGYEFCACGTGMTDVSLPIFQVAVQKRRIQDDLTDPPKPEFFLPYDQATYWPQCVILRVSGEPRAYMNSVRSVVARLNRNLPIFAVATMDELVVGSATSRRFEAALLTCFAASALLLAAVGLYAALSEMVVRRTFEI